MKSRWSGSPTHAVWATKRGAGGTGTSIGRQQGRALAMMESGPSRTAMHALTSQIFPLIYGACFLLLLWQAFRVMGQGFKAVPRPGDRVNEGDRTGRLTIHPELLDDQGQLTQEDLLTVRFGSEGDQPASPGSPR
jgi:hypothetical protein